MLRVGIPDLISPSYFPVIAAAELGFLAEEGVPATVELVYPVPTTFHQLAEGALDLAVGAAHAPLYAFGDWQGCRLLGALSQHMYWFLVLRSDLGIGRGDLAALRGLRIGAAPGPVDGLRRLLIEAGIDPETDLELCAVPGTSDGSVSFGVTAAEALRTGALDGFWANGMGAEVAVSEGTGTVALDARRGDGPPGAADYTFAALVATERRVRDEPEQLAAVLRAIARTHAALTADPGRAAEAARPRFPAHETSLITQVIARDLPFYQTAIAPGTVSSLNRFAHWLGLLSVDDVAYEEVVATDLAGAWTWPAES
ncbi:MAG TPA: ABC transporter substrate-binding protein [Acidimicrobiales bacterium]|nr:ABC transporter substrate-binding protein [Acidimicrobiales bacterium]